ncbi:hypothetical protein J2W76_003981 [Methylorubrum zatmanii]|uniref:hypothetical protein n=1 Tax=Methylorubrum extorquens TaxID=408 RepID=UPI0020A0CA0A|nr:hypothetical protein [Methylorubrum extorquens]MCP1550736.1 hypothetical protein [Methylorubrum zatmanii]
MLLALPDDPPSREVVRLSVGESDGQIEIGGTDHPESFDLRTLICAPIKGQTTMGKVLALPPRHPLWREARRLTGVWAEFDASSEA